MTERRAPHLFAWEKDYRRRGAVWRGTTNFAPPSLKGRVLELGCGNGKTASALSLQKQVELHAVDSSPTAVGLCKQLVERVGGKAVVREANGLQLDYATGFFDAVVCFHYLGHMPSNERNKAVAEATRVLKKNGKLFFREFGTKDFRLGKGKEVEPDTFVRGNGIWTHYFSQEEVRGLFPLLEESIEPEQWSILLRGKRYPREEINAVFRKP
ncbi:class I SAM-dependent methyltransferase [Candidatus Micrarchaeota archaeon]|nr:class I SAM-dependent methyltransferase [Candidatus Micrarchaeota archaeon]